MELRKKIIETSIELFKEEGLKFTLLQVASSMHISKKTIYKVYNSKEALLMDMVDTLFSGIHKSKNELMNSCLPIEEKIRRVIIALPDEFSALDFRLMDTLEEKYPKVAKHVRSHLETGWDSTIALLEEGMKQGKIRKVSTQILRQMITASIESFLEYRIENISYGDTLTEMIDIIMDGIKTTG